MAGSNLALAVSVSATPRALTQIQREVQGVLKHPSLAMQVAQDMLLPVSKRGGVEKSMGNKLPWKIGMLIYLLVIRDCKTTIKVNFAFLRGLGVG